MAFPEKEFFTLSEVIERWRHLKCDLTLLCDLARRDEIIFSVYLREIGAHKTVEDLGDVVRTRRTTTIYLLGDRPAYQPLKFLRGNDARRILEARPNEEIQVDVLYTDVSRSPESGTGYGSGKFFKVEDLLISRVERDRFEKLHGILPMDKSSDHEALKNLLANLCERFGVMAANAKASGTVTIADEHEMQKFLHPLLLQHFSDVRAEDYSPSSAGGNSRVDFLLPEIKTVVEAKMTRPTLRDKGIGEQLIVDIDRYKKHPDCKTLFCLVYDPGRLLRNPAGLERDLSRVTDGLDVRVFVSV